MSTEPNSFISLYTELFPKKQKSRAMKRDYQFLPHGIVLEHIEDNAFYIETGAIAHPRVFDYHAGQTRKKMRLPSEMIWESKDAILRHTENSDSITIYTHKHPDWNVCWCVTLLNWILEGRHLEETRISALNTYSGFILTGFNPSECPVEKSAVAVYESLMAEIEETGQCPHDRDLKKIQAGMEFFQFCYDAADDYKSLKTGDFFSEDGPYGRAMLMVREDYQVYLQDLQESRRFTALLRRKSGKSYRVDGLKMGPPLSRLFKFWSRSDLEHSYYKAGFPLLWVQWETNRWIISVNPASGYLLKGLGDFLTAEECKINPPDSTLPIRPGYECPNPWYDARNTPNAFAIVDSPYNGTKIPPKQLEKLLKKFFKVRQWRPAVEKPSWIRDRLIPYGIPALSLIGVIVIGWCLISLPRMDCDQWKNLKPVETRQAKYIAIVIGINEYDRSERWQNLSTPVNDAKEIMRILTQKYGFDTDKSILMTSGGSIPPDFENIKKTIKQTAEQLTPDDSLLIYFSGHGDGKKEDMFGKWIPSDGDSDAKCIENSWLQRVLQKCPARHIMIIADCCYAGKLFDDGKTRGQVIWNVPLKITGNMDEIYQKPSRQGLVSGNLEPVPDGLGQHSPFAECLIPALDKNRQPFMTAGMLFKKIYDCSRFSSEAKKPFLFVIPDTCDQQGEFVFRKK